jgi:SAM-dependent methyltransferase
VTTVARAPFAASAELYDLVYGDKDYAGEAARIHELVREHVAGEARTLLDVACGTGRHLEPLASALTVEGLELDPALLDVARGRLGPVPLHQGDMTDFDLGRTFDAVTCLFSSIGYVRTVDRLHAAVAAMGRHVRAGGVLLVEPWFGPDAWVVGRVHTVVREEAARTVVRMMVSGLADGASVLEARYLIGTAAGIQSFDERHELGLFTEDDHRAAFVAAGLRPTLDRDGLTGRGLWIATREEDRP